MKTNQDKEFFRSLPEEVQDSVAAATLSQLKNRARLESLAAGAAWMKFWWILPIVVPLVVLVLGRDSLFPIGWFLFSVMLMAVAHLHFRMNAIYQLMKEDHDSRLSKIREVEQNLAPTHTGP